MNGRSWSVCSRPSISRMQAACRNNRLPSICRSPVVSTTTRGWCSRRLLPQHQKWVVFVPAVGTTTLTGLYGEQTPGVGGSVGVDRLMSLLEPETVPPATVVILNLGVTEPLFRIATALRAANISCEVYPEDRKLKQQLKYADTVGASFAIIAGSSELERNQCQVKNLKTGEAIDVALQDCATKVAELLKA